MRAWLNSVLYEVTQLNLLLDEMYAGLKGAKDKDIVEYAKKNDLLLVTQDQKPADLAHILAVKCVLISNAMIAKMADSEIREKYPNTRQK